MILDTIAAATKKRVATAKEIKPLDEVQQEAMAMPKGDLRFERALKKAGMSFICEVKKASPSKGLIAPDFPYIDIAREYETAGASACLSTDGTGIFPWQRCVPDGDTP